MYSIYAAGTSELLAEGFEEFGKARETAEHEAQERSIEVIVKHDETGVVAYATSPKAMQVAENPGDYFTPWTRIENPKFEAPVFEGFIPAYTRKRIQATVYRKVDDKGWRVHDGRNGNYADVGNTKEACALTSAMRQGKML